MSVIETQELTKIFKVPRKEVGLKGAVNALLRHRLVFMQCATGANKVGFLSLTGNDETNPSDRPGQSVDIGDGLRASCHCRSERAS